MPEISQEQLRLLEAVEWLLCIADDIKIEQSVDNVPWVALTAYRDNKVYETDVEDDLPAAVEKLKKVLGE